MPKITDTQERREQYLIILSFVGALLLNLVETNAPGNGFNQNMQYSGSTRTPALGLVTQFFSETGFYLALTSVFNCISEMLFSIVYHRFSSLYIPTASFILSVISNTIAFTLQDYAYWFGQLVSYAPASANAAGFWAGQSVQICWVVYLLYWGSRVLWALGVLAIANDDIPVSFRLKS